VQPLDTLRQNVYKATKLQSVRQKPGALLGFLHSVMTQRAPSPCRHTGCPVLVKDGSGYCDKHQPAGSFADPYRGSRHARGYGTAWDKLRKLILSRDKGLCQVCLAAGKYRPAKHVDHITAKAFGGLDEPDNLQAICPACHAEKTAAEAASGRGVKKSNPSPA
jgi:5-methylcytosine-specific restriction protein A